MIMIMIIIIIIFRCHRPFLSGTSLESTVTPTAQASSFTLQYFPYYGIYGTYSTSFVTNKRDLKKMKNFTSSLQALSL
jgi:hypothetical protein